MASVVCVAPLVFFLSAGSQSRFRGRSQGPRPGGAPLRQPDAGGPGYGSTVRSLAEGRKRRRTLTDTGTRKTYNLTGAQTTRATGLVPAGGSAAAWPDPPGPTRDWVAAAFTGAAGLQADIDQARATEDCPLFFSVARVGTVTPEWEAYAWSADHLAGYAEPAEVVFLTVEQGTDLTVDMLQHETQCRGTSPLCTPPRPAVTAQGRVGHPGWSTPHFHCALCAQQGSAPGRYTRRATYVAHWKRCHSDVPATRGVLVDHRFCWLYDNNPTSEWLPEMSSGLQCEFHTDDPAKECHWHMSGWVSRDYLDLDGRKSVGLRRYACSAHRREVAPSEGRRVAAAAVGRTAEPYLVEARIDCYEAAVVALVHAKMMLFLKDRRAAAAGAPTPNPARLVVGNMPLYATLQRARVHPGTDSSAEPVHRRHFWTVGLLDAAFLAFIGHGSMEDAYRVVYQAVLNGHLTARWMSPDVLARPPNTITRRTVGPAVLAMCFSVVKGGPLSTARMDRAFEHASAG